MMRMPRSARWSEGVLGRQPKCQRPVGATARWRIPARRQLREAGLDPQQAPRWELADLAPPEAEALAREVLGPQHAYAARRLASATRDCPFLLVTGALLSVMALLSCSVSKATIISRRELIESLADTISPGATDQPEVRQEVLRAVAALQPLRTADKDFRDALEELTGRVVRPACATPVCVGRRRDPVAPGRDLPGRARPARRHPARARRQRPGRQVRPPNTSTVPIRRPQARRWPTS